MNRQTPWDEIQIPSIDYNVRLVTGAGKVPVYWGRDVDGHCLLIVELNGDNEIQFRKDAVQVHGLRLDLRQGNEGRQRLVLTLEKHVDQDLFSSLCGTLIASLSLITVPASALSVVLSHIKRWKAFLAGKKKRLLTPDEIRGLFGELLFLRSLYLNHLSEKLAIEAWCGVEGVHQDFIFGNTSVEIKTLSGKERNTVNISSEDQLESFSDNLFLMIYRLNDIPDSDQALSLNDAVRQIENELTDAETLEIFSTKLSGYGYLPVQEYDQPRLQIISIKTFRVTEEFPRLIRAQLPEGVTRVSYQIKLEKISPFEVGQELIFRR